MARSKNVKSRVKAAAKKSTKKVVESKPKKAAAKTKEAKRIPATASRGPRQNRGVRRAGRSKA